MVHRKRKFAGAVAAAFLMTTMTSCLGAAGGPGFAGLGGRELPKTCKGTAELAFVALEESVKLLEQGKYLAAKLEAEPLLDPNDPLGNEITCDQVSLDQARYTWLMANSLSQINEWVENLATILGVAESLDLLAPDASGLQALGGSGLLAGTIDGFLSEFIKFFETNVEVLKEIKSNEAFNIRYRNLPIKFGPLPTLMNLKGEHDLGEVYFVDMVHLFIASLLNIAIAIDYTINLDFPINHIIEVVENDLADPDTTSFTSGVLNLLGVVLYTQPKLLGLADAQKMQRAGNQLGDAFASFVNAFNFMKGEVDSSNQTAPYFDQDQSDDVVGFDERSNGDQILTLHIEFSPQPIPGIDATELTDLEIRIDEEILNSLANIRDAFGGKPGVRISWARDLVPIISVIAATLLQSGAFDGLIDAVLESSEVDAATREGLDGFLGSSLLDANLIEGVILGIIPDVFEFDVGAYFKQPQASIRDFLPYWTYPEEVTDLEIDSSSPTGFTVVTVTDWYAITMLVDYECDDGSNDHPEVPDDNEIPNDPSSGAQALICDGDGLTAVDADHFYYGQVTTETFANLHGDLVKNLKEMHDYVEEPNHPFTVPNSDEIGIRQDDVTSKLPYFALRDPTLGNILYIKLDSASIDFSNEQMAPYDNGQFNLATNRTFNTLIHGLFAGLLEAI